MLRYFSSVFAGRHFYGCLILPGRLFETMQPFQAITEEIAQLCLQATTTPTETGIPDVVMIQGDVPEHQLAAIYEPYIGLLIQGAKTLSIGDQVLRMLPPSYFIISVELPATGRVEQGPKGLPYLSLGLRLNQKMLVDLLSDVPERIAGDDSEGFQACKADREFLEAWLRLLRLMKTPQHIQALGPLYTREILYRALIGPQGWRLYHVCQMHGRELGIHYAIDWLRKNFLKRIEIRALADRSGMAVTTLHRQFKQITGQSPIQFQKQLRLLEARKLIAFGGCSAASAAYQVGYESTSQFNREYARFFGNPPVRDAIVLRRSSETDLTG